MAKKKKKQNNIGRGPSAHQTPIQRAIANNTYHPDDESDDSEHATDAQPGGEDGTKLEILAARAAAGLPLWDVNDKTIFRTGTELIGNRGDEHLCRRYAQPVKKHPKKGQ